MEHRKDITLFQEADERSALGEIPAFDIIHMRIVYAAVGDRRQTELTGGLKGLEGRIILVPAVKTVVIDLVRHFELRPEIGRIQLTRQIAVAEIDPGVLIDLAAEELSAVGAFLAQYLGLLDIIGVVYDDGAALAHGVVLRLMERVAAEVADRAEGPALVACHDALGRVLNDKQFMAAGNVHDRVHLTGNAGIVHDADDLGLIGDGTLDKRLVDVHRVRADVDKHELCPGEDEGVCGAGESEAREDDLIPRLKAAQERRHVKGGAAAGGEEHFLRAKALLEPCVALFGKAAVAADLVRGDGLLDIFHFVPGAGRHVEVYHIFSSLPSIDGSVNWANCSKLITVHYINIRRRIQGKNSALLPDMTHGGVDCFSAAEKYAICTAKIRLLWKVLQNGVKILYSITSLRCLETG